MKKTIKFFILCLFAANISYAQSNKELAEAKAKEAIRIEDEEGRFDAAIELLQEAQNLDPESITYPYELSYAYQGKKDYKKAIDILEKLLKHKDVYAQIYHALGNAYDYSGKPKKAMQAYEDGLKKFPDAGELYLELGNMNVSAQDYNKALTYYEKGIEVDPAYPSNYYWAAKIFCGSSERVWGMIYGEIFMNLERNSKRTAEISKLLFDTYQKAIVLKSDTSISVSFSKNNTINASDLLSGNFKLPFGTGCYEMVTIMAVAGFKSVDLNTLDSIRTGFVTFYFNGNKFSKYPNVLFDYQQKIKNAGFLDAYNHWILMKGDEAGFLKWQDENKARWMEFINWFDENKLALDDNHKFYRAQY
ncbi:tetratricopeptide repeat protein [Danxiaibacter flavus]|uniref:Tetratricopeptide repeat protein n=1 Tax=Danxiaibacter flavus TaxID=3049108 RepID=A0ABV3ZF77_9BACT|nr:tetratricopeptide repeat protein [Chitinophagaceae bacterium DXS]